MRILLLTAALLLGSVPGLLAGEEELTALRQTHALLQAEYELAKSNRPYLLIDLPERQLLFKVSGLTVARWGIVAYRSWGNPATPGAAMLTGKHSLDEPERTVRVAALAPAEGAEPAAAPTAAELETLELDDMPARYRLQFDSGLRISVRPTSDGWGGRLQRLLATPFWYLSRPLISDWNFLKGSPYNELALSLAEQDARKLYWACMDACPCLIRTPAAVPATQAPLATGTNQ